MWRSIWRLRKYYKRQNRRKAIGFGKQVKSQKDVNQYEIFKELLPQDLLKFGLIPEFIGRLPIIATLKDLDKEALIKILVEPKNSLVKQYQKTIWNWWRRISLWTRSIRSNSR